MKYLFLSIILIVLSLNAFGQKTENAANQVTVAADNATTNTKTTVGVEEVYLAKDDGAGQAGDAATSFATTDIPIYCVVQLDSMKPVTVKMNLVAVSVKGVKPETRVITTSYKTNGRQNRVNFTGSPDGNWVAGNYRVDVFIDGKLAESRNFEIKNASVNKVEATEAAVKSFQPKQTTKSNKIKKIKKTQFARN